MSNSIAGGNMFWENSDSKGSAERLKPKVMLKIDKYLAYILKKKEWYIRLI